MIQFLRGTQTQLNSSSQVFAAGQPIFESDSGQLKIGNGSSRYSSLPYVGSIFESSGGGSGLEMTVGGDYDEGYLDFSNGIRISWGAFSRSEGYIRNPASSNGIYYTPNGRTNSIGTNAKSTALFTGGWIMSTEDRASATPMWLTYWEPNPNGGDAIYRVAWIGDRVSPPFEIRYFCISR